MTNRLFHVLCMLILFELGVLLLFLPWAGFWETNYFVTHYPVLRPYLLHPAMRGAISGLGALDVLIAARMLQRRPAGAETHNA